MGCGIVRWWCNGHCGIVGWRYNVGCGIVRWRYNVGCGIVRWQYNGGCGIVRWRYNVGCGIVGWRLGRWYSGVVMYSGGFFSECESPPLYRYPTITQPPFLPPPHCIPQRPSYSRTVVYWRWWSSGSGGIAGRRLSDTIRNRFKFRAICSQHFVLSWCSPTLVLQWINV